jgi:hypothetical protein
MRDIEAGRRKLPRHVVGAILVAIAVPLGIALLVMLPPLGVPGKLAGAIGMAVWLVATIPFWTGGTPPGSSTGAAKPPADADR